ncbi:leucine-rich repeat domain-containing protein [Helcococcus bovis]|uniref:leucine-rich repeat domain-containing protein n=1 Tax=Helcococcus bovis TaxID=3153252 RepID=UPI0038BC65A3
MKKNNFKIASLVLAFFLIIPIFGYEKVGATDTNTDISEVAESKKIVFEDPYVEEILLNLFKDENRGSYSGTKRSLGFNKDNKNYTIPKDRDYITVGDAMKVVKLSLRTPTEYDKANKKHILLENTISSLGGLEHFTNLEELNIGFNNVEDISVVRNMPKLKNLSVGGNKIIDISPASTLTNLNYLNFDNNLISDISSLENVPVKNYITSHNNYIKDLGYIAGSNAKKQSTPQVILVYPDTNTFELYLRDDKGNDGYFISDNYLAQIGAKRIGDTNKYRFNNENTEESIRFNVSTNNVGDLFDKYTETAEQANTRSSWIIKIDRKYVKLPKARGVEVEQFSDINDVNFKDYIDNLFEVDSLENVSKNPIDTSVPGAYVADIKINYSYGDSEIIKVPVYVNPKTQNITVGIMIDQEVVKSNGDNTDGALELPEELRDLVITLTNQNTGEKFVSGDSSTWIGDKDFPLVQNFGLADVPVGDYLVEISGYEDYSNYNLINNLKRKETLSPRLNEKATLNLNTQEKNYLYPNQKITIDGNTSNLFVAFEEIIDRFVIGVEVRGLDGKRNSELGVKIINEKGEELEGEYNEYIQYLSQKTTPGEYTIKFENLPKNTKVVLNDLASNKAVATNNANEFKIVVDADELRSVPNNRVWGAFKLEEVPSESESENPSANSEIDNPNANSKNEGEQAKPDNKPEEQKTDKKFDKSKENKNQNNISNTNRDNIIQNNRDNIIQNNNKKNNLNTKLNNKSKNPNTGDSSLISHLLGSVLSLGALYHLKKKNK